MRRTLTGILMQALDRVHESNLSKLGEDGKPIYREDGKVLKGPNYQPPNLTDLV
jgi:predicted HAD superfamily Cof-like phosphohydrolase